jgi:hypothetical protein
MGGVSPRKKNHLRHIPVAEAMHDDADNLSERRPE